MIITAKKFEINTLYLSIDEAGDTESFLSKEIMFGNGLVKYRTFFHYFNNLLDDGSLDTEITLSDNCLVATCVSNFITVELDRELLSDADFVSHISQLLKKSLKHKIDGLKGRTNRENKRRLFLPNDDFLRSVAKLLQYIINNPSKDYNDDIVTLLMLAREYVQNASNDLVKINIIREFMEIKERIIPVKEDLLSQIESLEHSVDSLIGSNEAKQLKMKPTDNR